MHGWRRLAREAGAETVPKQFVPVAVAPAVPRSAENERIIEVELRRGGITVLSWPMSASMDLSLSTSTSRRIPVGLRARRTIWADAAHQHRTGRRPKDVRLAFSCEELAA